MSGVHPYLPARDVHSWLQKINLTFVPGPTTPLLAKVAVDLEAAFRKMGHTVQEAPDANTDLILTTAPFGKAINWREALLFTGRRRYKLEHTPTIITLIHARPTEFQERLDYFAAALRKDPLDPADFSFPDLAPSAHRTLIEQGMRGGPILSLERLLQSQSKSIRILLVVGADRPQAAYHFDLVGAFPRTVADGGDAFYEDIVLRITTVLSTGEVTQHQAVGEPVPYPAWSSLSTPQDMRRAARELGRRGFFTEMVRIADLVYVPALDNAVARQYSEGCFATWDLHLKALVATITGSARPVDKDNITEDELAVIVGVRPDGKGALVRLVDKKRNAPPSSEAVEMMAMDGPLPKVEIGLDGRGDGGTFQVPVARSKLHGHRGVAAYHPDHVEYVPLDPPYYSYPVSCATEAQARGIQQAFARSESLKNPSDPRQVVFTVLPGHGVVMVEKWQPEKVPFQLIWEFMDSGILQIESRIPQGAMAYAAGPDRRRHLQALEFETDGGTEHALDLC
jgi:hypothetical protein